MHKGEEMSHKIQMSYLMQYLATEDVAGGSIVEMGAVDPFVAVPVADIKQGEIGTVDPQGVYPLPKESGAIAQADPLYLSEGGKVTTAAGGTYVGRAHVAAGANEATVRVMLNFMPPAASAE